MNKQLPETVILAIALTLAAGAVWAQKQSADSLFREGLIKERAEGDLRGAIFRYERVLVEFPKERQTVAQALYQLSLAYEKLGDPRARLMLTRLVGEYAEVEPFASRARTRLAEQSSGAEALFPAVTLDKDYELGSPDGKFVIYHKDPSDWGRQYVKEPATGKERLLLDHPGKSVSNFAWSPDSRQLAYNFMDAEAKVNEIRTVQVSSGETTSLGVRYGYPLYWTDAGEIFFYRPNYAASGADYFLVPAKGGTPRKVYFDPTCCPAISPAGTHLVVSKSKKLFVVDMSSGEEQALTTGSGEESRPLISPDGRLVAFAANPEGNWAFYLAPLDKGLPVKEPLKIASTAQPVEGGGGWPSRQWWTRDGLLTFGLQQSETNLYRVDMDPKTGRAVDAPGRLTQDASNNWLPAISPDGKRIAYWYRNGTKVGIAVMDSNGTNERPLWEQPAVLPLGWRSPEEILFYQGKPKEKPSIQSLNTTTGALQRVAQVEGLYWRYVPSRQEILHLYPGGGGPRVGATLKAFSLAEGKDRVVAQMDYLLHVWAVSPDGKRIAYSTSRPVSGSNQRVWELRLMSINGEPEGTLITAQPEGVVASAWSPDGKFLLYMQEKIGPKVMNVQTRESWPLHPDAKDEMLVRGPSWSPDGTFVLVHKGATRSERLAWEGVTAEAVARIMQAQP